MTPREPPFPPSLSLRAPQHLVRMARAQGTPVLAGTLHLKTKFFSDKDKAGTSLDLAPLTPIISRLKPIKNAMRLALESPVR